MRNEYLISDLAKMADVTKRTIHYYVNKGLLPSPAGSGLGSRYTDEHYYRLLYIKELKKEYIPLAKIKEILIDLDIEEIRRRVVSSGDQEICAMITSSEFESINTIKNIDSFSINNRIELMVSEDIIRYSDTVNIDTEELVRARFQNKMELTYPKKIENDHSTKKIIKMIREILEEKE